MSINPYSRQVCLLASDARLRHLPIVFWGYDSELVADLYAARALDGSNVMFVSDDPREIGQRVLNFTIESASKLDSDKTRRVIILTMKAIRIYENLIRKYGFKPKDILMHPDNFGYRLYDEDPTPWKTARELPWHIKGDFSADDIPVHLYNALRHIALRKIAGDIVELGVYQGKSAYYLAKVRSKLGLDDRRLWAFDTFAGFVEDEHELDTFCSTGSSVWPETKDAKTIFQDTSLDLVKNNLREFSNLELVVGDIRKTVSVLKDKTISLAFFDMDDYTPTAAALPLVYERLSPGGFMVFDHYHWGSLIKATCLGQRLAMIEFNHDNKMFNPLGTNLFIKI